MSLIDELMRASGRRLPRAPQGAPPEPPWRPSGIPGGPLKNAALQGLLNSGRASPPFSIPSPRPPQVAPWVADSVAGRLSADRPAPVPPVFPNTAALNAGGVSPITQMPVAIPGEMPQGPASLFGGGQRTSPGFAGGPAETLLAQRSVIPANMGLVNAEATTPQQWRFDQMAAADIPYEQAMEFERIRELNEALSTVERARREAEQAMQSRTQPAEPFGPFLDRPQMTETGRAAGGAGGLPGMAGLGAGSPGVPWRTGNMEGDLAQNVAGAGFRDGFSPLEQQVNSRHPWQPNVGGLPMSAAAQNRIAQREQMAADNARRGDYQRNTPREPGDFASNFYDQNPFGEAATIQDYAGAMRGGSDAAAEGNAPMFRPAPWTSSPGGNSSGKTVPWNPENEQFVAAQQERDNELDIRRRMVTAQSQGRPITQSQALVEQGRERKQRMIAKMLGEGKELPRDLRSPQENANTDAVEIKRMEAAAGVIAGLAGPNGEPPDPYTVDAVLDRMGFNKPPGGGMDGMDGMGGVDHSTMNHGGQPANYQREWDRAFRGVSTAEQAKLEIKEWEKIAISGNLPREEIDRKGREYFGGTVWDRRDEGYGDMFGRWGSAMGRALEPALNASPFAPGGDPFR